MIRLILGLVLSLTAGAFAKATEPSRSPSVPVEPCAGSAVAVIPRAFIDMLVEPGRAFQPPPLQPPGMPAVDPFGLCRYAAADAGARAPVDVVFMGDSLSDLWQMADPAFFSDRIVDRGVSGQTSAQMLVRFTPDVVRLHPRVVQILAGANDIAGNGGPTSIRAVEDNIHAMIDLARIHHIRVILGTIPVIDRVWWAPQLRLAQSIQELDTWIRQTAAREGLGVADYASALTDPAGGVRAALTNDGVHPNRAGYRVMRPIALDAIARTR